MARLRYVQFWDYDGNWTKLSDYQIAALRFWALSDEQRARNPLSTPAVTTDSLVDRGYLVWNGRGWDLTRRGWHALDAVTS